MQRLQGKAALVTGASRGIGRCAVYLASADADYVTGAFLRVDGGYMVGLQLPAEEWKHD